MKRNIIFFGIVFFIIFSLTYKGPSITGTVILEAPVGNEGCCEFTCSHTTRPECPDFSQFHPNTHCNDIDDSRCNNGCCIDPNGYCLNNYYKGNCDRVDGDFIDRTDCNQFWFCLSRPAPDSIIRNMGYEHVFEAGQHGVTSIEPFAGTSNTKFEITFIPFNEIEKVEAEIKDSSGNEVLAQPMHLYDDGQHLGDLTPDDGIYGNGWDSSSYDLTGKKRELFSAEIAVYKNNIRLDSIERVKSKFLLTKDRCLPQLSNWDPDRKSIFFFTNGDMSQAKNPIVNQIGLLGLDNFREYNFYTVELDSLPSDFVNALISECPDLYEQVRDTIIFVDENEEGCSQTDKYFIKTGSPAIFNQTMLTGKNVDYFLENFCKASKTQKQYEQELLSRYMPHIEILSPSDDPDPYLSSDGSVEISFKVTDAYPGKIKYEIYLDDETLFEPIESKEVTLEADKTAIVSATLNNICNGEHVIWVKATTQDGKRYDEAGLLVNVEDGLLSVEIKEPVDDEVCSTNLPSKPNLLFEVKGLTEVSGSYEYKYTYKVVKINDDTWNDIHTETQTGTSTTDSFEKGITLDKIQELGFYSVGLTVEDTVANKKACSYIALFELK